MNKNLTTFYALLTFLTSGYAFSQVGISKTNNFTPDAASILDVSSADKGILIPRVALTSATSLSPVTTTGSAPTSLLVYNTASAGASPDNVVPGFYYWDAAGAGRWKPLDTDLNTNLYNVDGTLSSNRVVTQDSKTLTFVDGLGRNITTTSPSLVFGATSTTDNYPNMALLSAQRRVGINKKDPRVTLDIQAGTTSDVAAEGILIPKLSVVELGNKDASYNSRISGSSTSNTGQTSHEGTLIYVFPDLNGNVIPRPESVKTQLITKEGFYYYGMDDKWHPIGGGAAAAIEPWNVQASTTQATSNTDNIYQQGNVAIGTTSTNAARTEKLYVNGNTRINQGNLNASRFNDEDANNKKSYTLNLSPGYSQLFHSSHNVVDQQNVTRSYKGLADIRIGSDEGFPLSHQQNDIGGANMTFEVGSTTSKDFGLYSLIASPARNLGYGMHNFISSNRANGKVSFFNIDEYGINIGKVYGDPAGSNNITTIPSSPFENILSNPTGKRMFYTLPLDPPTIGQVLTFDSNVENTENLYDLTGEFSGQEVISKTKTKWSNISDLTSAATEPWLVQGSTTQASANTQNIYQMGKVAIGAGGSLLTGDSASVMLHVNGDIESTGRVFSSNSVFADYVFQKYYTGTSTLNDKYDFKSLKYVKDFTAKNHHLPGVTPVSEIMKTDKGYKIDLAELSIQQLEKIEELYLHVIEQQEQIDEKNKEIEKLKSQQEDLNSRLLKLEELISKK